MVYGLDVGDLSMVSMKCYDKLRHEREGIPSSFTNSQCMFSSRVQSRLRLGRT